MRDRKLETGRAIPTCPLSETSPGGPSDGGGAGGGHHRLPPVRDRAEGGHHLRQGRFTHEKREEKGKKRKDQITLCS